MRMQTLGQEILITEQTGQPEIDLLASYSNAKVACYYWWKPDPGAAHVDAFTVSCSGPQTYCFPPVSLLGRCLQKICYGSSRRYCSNSELANTTLRFQSHGNVGQSTASLPSRPDSYFSFHTILTVGIHCFQGFNCWHANYQEIP